jgi:hypothetical protein
VTDSSARATAASASARNEASRWKEGELISPAFKCLV